MCSLFACVQWPHIWSNHIWRSKEKEVIQTTPIVGYQRLILEVVDIDRERLLGGPYPRLYPSPLNKVSLLIKPFEWGTIINILRFISKCNREYLLVIISLNLYAYRLYFWVNTTNIEALVYYRKAFYPNLNMLILMSRYSFP